MSRSLAPSEWNEMDAWLKQHSSSIGLKEVTWIMDVDDLCFKVCITTDNSHAALLFKLSWY
jgi:hypothetical protein